MPVSPKNIKDTDTLFETVRQYEHSDPLYYDILNRPLEDIGRRTLDVNRIFTPARSLRVRQTQPATTSVQVEVGFTIIEDPAVAGAYQLPSTKAAVTVVGPVAAAAGGLRRIDLIYFNLATDAIALVAGAEVAAATPWATVYSVSKGAIPASDGGNIPLAYLYVDDTGPVYDETVAIDTAGHIRDARLAPGVSRRVFEST